MSDSTHAPEIKVKIADKEIIYSHLSIEQSVASHHHFSFLWKTGNFKSDLKFQYDILGNSISKKVNITIGKNSFEGIITEMSIDDRDGSHSFNVSGQSPTILLEDSPRSTSYYQKSLEDIVKNTFKDIPGNYKKAIDPEFKSPIHYLSQYNETDFLFLKRLATRYGEWFYYDGQTIHFGGVQDSGVKLESGTSLQHLTVRASLQSDKFAYTSHDAYEGEKLDSEMKPHKAESENEFVKSTADNSGNIFARQGDRKIHTFNAINKKQLDALQELDNKASVARLLTITGNSTDEGLKSGYKFSIKGRGGYIATSVTHSSSAPGNYENSFTAVPDSVKVPPYTSPHVIRKCEMQPAIVKDNKDDKKLGRIKVKFPWTDNSPWMRISSPHSGKDKGWHFIPEIGEDVMVDFEGGDVDKPFVIGSVYTGNAKSGLGDDDNNIKSLKTRSGNNIILNDKEGSITIIDPKGSVIYIKGDETIEIKSKKKILIQSEEINIKADKNINIEAGEQMNIKSGKAMKLSSQDTMGQDSMKEFKISSMDKLTTTSMQDTKISASTNASLEGTVQASVKGTQISLEGTAQAALKAAIVMIN